MSALLNVSGLGIRIVGIDSGDGQTSEGERRESAALSRQYPDYAALMAVEEFEAWCDALYRPLFDAPWRSLTGEESR